MNKTAAIKKVEIAIDKLIDLQDAGFGTDAIERALDLLRTEWSRLKETNHE